MSSFLQNTKNPKTGKFEPAMWLDDYYGNHNYGVRFLDGEWFDPRKTDMETKSGPVKASWDDFFPQHKQQEQGNDMAAPEPLANTEPDKSAQGTIEDKLDETLAEYFTWKGEAIHEINRTENYKRLKDKLRAIITTETTKARVDEIKRFDVGVPISANAIQSRLAALQKERHDLP